MKQTQFTEVFDSCVKHAARVKYEIWYKGAKGAELVDEFDNESTAKASVRDYETAFNAKPGSVYVKKVTY